MDVANTTNFFSAEHERDQSSYEQPSFGVSNSSSGERMSGVSSMDDSFGEEIVENEEGERKLILVPKDKVYSIAIVTHMIVGMMYDDSIDSPSTNFFGCIIHYAIVELCRFFWGQ